MKLKTVIKEYCITNPA